MSETKGAISLAELQASTEYLACTPKMQVWLTTLIQSNFDYKLATVKAFNCKNLRQAHIFSYAVRKWPVIRAALNLYLGRSEQDVFLADLQETIRRAPKGSVAQVRAQALYARLKFGVSTPDSEPEPEAETGTSPARFSVGDTCQVDGKPYRITAVDANGRPTSGEPL
jgi:hypothetical protein